MKYIYIYIYILHYFWHLDRVLVFERTNGKRKQASVTDMKDTYFCEKKL